MNENNEIYTENSIDTVSGNQIPDNTDDNSDALPDVSEDPVMDDVLEESGEETGEDVIDLPDQDEADTVSGSDILLFLEDLVGNSVSAGDTYNITYETVEEVPIWEKAISDYTVTEGLLLLIFILLLVSFFTRILDLD